MYNGIGLTTPRGSGTNGYVLRNLSALRVHESPADRASVWTETPPKHREPDQGILEHEKKRKVEVKCLELQLELEDKGVEDDEIEAQVNALRERLLKNLAAQTTSVRGLKLADTHAAAAAKKVELARMAAALGTRSDYTEGDAFDREKQEEAKKRRVAEWQEKEKKRDEERAKVGAQKARWEAAKKEQDMRKRKEEDRLRKEAEDSELKRKERIPPPPPPLAPKDSDVPRERSRGYSDRREPYRAHERRRSISPGRPAPHSRRDARSRSPPPEPRRRPITRSPRSRSPSPPPTRRYRGHSRSRSRSPLPPARPSQPHRRELSPARRPRSRSMPRSLSRSRSPSLDGRSLESRVATVSEKTEGKRGRDGRSASPPARRGGRSRSASTGSSMSVSTGSSRGSRSRSRGRSR